jgi:hypothetical protein
MCRTKKPEQTNKQKTKEKGKLFLTVEFQLINV